MCCPNRLSYNVRYGAIRCSLALQRLEAAIGAQRGQYEMRNEPSLRCIWETYRLRAPLRDRTPPALAARMRH
jgi:hypothetical protein